MRLAAFLASRSIRLAISPLPQQPTCLSSIWGPLKKKDLALWSSMFGGMEFLDAQTSTEEHVLEISGRM
jgi:hypothetical protein